MSDTPDNTGLVDEDARRSVDAGLAALDEASKRPAVTETEAVESPTEVEL